MALSQETLSFGFALMWCLYRDILHAKNLAIILTKERKTKVLFNLCGCARWSVPLIFACNKIRFSCDMAHIEHGSNCFYVKIVVGWLQYVDKAYCYIHGRIQNILSEGEGGSDFFWSTMYFTEGRTNLPREAIGPEGSNCFSKGGLYQYL